MSIVKSKQIFEEANKYIPGGVNSPVRAFKAVDSVPPFIVRADGSKIYDEDDNEYIDYIGSYGPMILGHNPKIVREKLQEQLNKSLSYGAPTKLEVELAKLICEIVPSVEMIRMVNSGTEATMSAIRVARGYTGRDKVVKFAGNYHGHEDCLLVAAGSGALTFGVPSSSGVPKNVTKDTIVAEYNNIEALNSIFESRGEEIAAVIMEPVAGNMGVVPAAQEFIEYVRKVTEKYGTVLIIDEVMTGFRLALKGAQSLYNIKPDLTCFGKIIGGGLPVGAYGGRREIMECIAPLGPVYQAGTLSGNPLSMAAGFTTLTYLKNNTDKYVLLEKKSKKLQEGIEKAIIEYDIAARVNRVGSMLTVFFSESEVTDFASAKKCDTGAFSVYFNCMLEKGIYLPPSQFETFFVSLAHSDEDIERTIEAARYAFGKISAN